MSRRGEAGGLLREIERILLGLGVEGERILVDPESRSVLVTEVVEAEGEGGVRRIVLSVQILDQGESLLVAVPLLPFPLTGEELSEVSEDLLRLSLNAELAACGVTSDGYVVAFSELSRGELFPRSLWSRYGAALRALRAFLSEILPRHPRLEGRLLEWRGDESGGGGE